MIWTSGRPQIKYPTRHCALKPDLWKTNSFCFCFPYPHCSTSSSIKTSTFSTSVSVFLRSVFSTQISFLTRVNLNLHFMTDESVRHRFLVVTVEISGLIISWFQLKTNKKYNAICRVCVWKQNWTLILDCSNKILHYSSTSCSVSNQYPSAPPSLSLSWTNSSSSCPHICAVTLKWKVSLCCSHWDSVVTQTQWELHFSFCCLVSLTHSFHTLWMINNKMSVVFLKCETVQTLHRSQTAQLLHSRCPDTSCL